jgi:hypothetical protein
MDIKITKELAEKIGEEKLRKVGIEWNTRGYRMDDDFHLSLAKLTTDQTEFIRSELVALAERKLKGAAVLVQDIDLWKRAMGDAGKQRPRSVKQFASLLTEYLRRVPGHRIYKQLEDVDGKTYIAYYVNQVIFHEEESRSDNYRPPETELQLLYNEFGGRQAASVRFLAENCLGQNASESLARSGYFVETPELRKAYLAEVAKFNEIAPQVGIQYTAKGSGIADYDSDRYNRFGNRRMLNGEKVVIDVFSESSSGRGDRDAKIYQFFWSRATPEGIKATEGDKSEEDLVTDKGDATEMSAKIEIPVHPFVMTFALRLHTRLRLHVNFLTRYVYDTHMDEKLILPQKTKDLVGTLIAQSRTGFDDIIEGKGMGVTVLLGGPPGVGKTLTAEVFAEASEKPLYSIQAAQLGISADSVEKNLTQFLSRASRWGAIALIDEADVYIQTRDRNMEHNAIVASFLRVLEYQTSILFLTTNRANEVDDALISRCIARVNYNVRAKTTN